MSECQLHERQFLVHVVLAPVQDEGIHRKYSRQVVGRVVYLYVDVDHLQIIPGYRGGSVHVMRGCWTPTLVGFNLKVCHLIRIVLISMSARLSSHSRPSSQHNNSHRGRPWEDTLCCHGDTSTWWDLERAPLGVDIFIFSLSCIFLCPLHFLFFVTCFGLLRRLTLTVGWEEVQGILNSSITGAFRDYLINRVY